MTSLRKQSQKIIQISIAVIFIKFVKTAAISTIKMLIIMT